LTVAFTGGLGTTFVLFTTGEGIELLFGLVVVLALGGLVVFVLGGTTGVITGGLGTDP
jgi:hypothetical protein